MRSGSIPKTTGSCFACRGTARVCMTRTVEFSCSRPAVMIPTDREPTTAVSARRPPSPRPSAVESDPERPTAQKPRPADAPQRTPVPMNTGQPGNAAAVYQLHAFANDMSENERYYTRDHAETTTQKFGFDISMRRFTADGKWSSLKEGIEDHWDDPKNDSYVNYNKPFYAMRDGTIMGCCVTHPTIPGRSCRRKPPQPHSPRPTRNGCISPCATD